MEQYPLLERTGFFMMTKRNYSRRRRATRRPRNQIIIVCEGEKTEVTYFRRFRTRYSNVAVEPVHEKCTDPINIVKAAKKHQRDLDFGAGDELWCAFDIDSSTTEILKSALSLREKTHIQIALSNPSFELWFLLHFKYQQSKSNRTEVLSELRAFIPDYAKNKDIFDRLKPFLETAIQNSKRLKRMHENAGVGLFTRESNPSSQVFRLVEAINNLMERNRSKFN